MPRLVRGPGPGVATSSQSQSSLREPDIPTYQPPQFPLTRKGQTDFGHLSNDNTLETINEHLRQAVNFLTECAGDINGFVAGRAALEERRQKKNPEYTDEGLEEFRDRVESMTARMDEHVRKTIDGMQDISAMGTALKDTTERAQRQANTASTQHNAEDGNDGENGSYVTAPGQTQRSLQSRLQGAGTSSIYKNNITRSRDAYQSLSLRTRYSEHNDYVAFKTEVWETKHGGEDAPPVPHRNTWFDNPRGSPLPGTMPSGSRADEDSDDDIAIAREKMSTKCVLTLKEFEEPVSNRQCRHVFERDAIKSYIKDAYRNLVSTARQNRQTVPSGPAFCTCPVPGCNKHISETDLFEDTAVVRKIRRIQAHRQREMARDDDTEMGDAENGIMVDDDEDNEGFDDIENVTQPDTSSRHPPKREPRSSIR